MTAKTVSLNWNPEQQTILKDSDQYAVIMKKPNGVSGSDLLPMSLIGCASYDVVEILRKQKQDLLELKITAESIQDDAPPWRFRRIHIHYQVIGKNIDPEKVRRAIEISEEKYCSVYATLKDVVEITHDFEVLEA